MAGVPGTDLVIDQVEALLNRLQSGEGLAEDAVVSAAKGAITTVDGVALGVVDTADKTADQLGGEVFAALHHALEAARAIAGTTPSA